MAGQQRNSEIWTITVPDPVAGPERAKQLEAQGYDGICVVDSQCLSPDSFVGLALMGAATETLGLATGVTNPVTRHASTLATAALSVAASAGDRMILGIGRGDSSLFHIGQEPAKLGAFKTFVDQLAAYMRRQELDLDGTPSRLRWTKHWHPPAVPLDIAATGPKIIQYAATVADMITFAVGANPERLAWGIDLARTARAEAGLDPETLRFGAYVQCAPHPEIDRSIELLRGTVGTFAHFSGMEGSTEDGQAPEDREQFEKLHQNYERKKHTMATARHAQSLDTDFIARFAAVGPPDKCIEKLQAVVDAGADRLVFTFPSRDTDAADRRLADQLFVDEVMPALQGRS